MYFRLTPDSLFHHGRHPHLSHRSHQFISWLAGVVPIAVTLVLLTLLMWLVANDPNRVDFPPLWF